VERETDIARRSGLSLKCVLRRNQSDNPNFAASSPSLFECAQFVGWVERLVRRSSTSEGGSDSHQSARDGDGFRLALPILRSARFLPASVIANPGGAIQNCCSVKTVTTIPARSRSSTLCESTMPAPTLSAVSIHWRCWYPARAKKHGYGRAASLQLNSGRERPKNSVHQCWHEPCIG
jgi:hypothetical protein